MKQNFDIITIILKEEVFVMEILELKPVFKDYIWGGTRLKDDFGFETDIDPVAEAGCFPATRTAKIRLSAARLTAKR